MMCSWLILPLAVCGHRVALSCSLSQPETILMVRSKGTSVLKRLNCAVAIHLCCVIQQECGTARSVFQDHDQDVSCTSC